jgi:hypothetical protein
MLKRRMKLVADQGARAVVRLRQIETSIGVLNDEDLLDLADIFKGQASGPLGDLASVEMLKRGISLEQP